MVKKAARVAPIALSPGAPMDISQIPDCSPWVVISLSLRLVTIAEAL